MRATRMLLLGLLLARSASAAALVPPGGLEVLRPDVEGLFVLKGDEPDPSVLAPFAGQVVWVLVGGNGRPAESDAGLCVDAKTQLDASATPYTAGPTACVLVMTGPEGAAAATAEHWSTRTFLPAAGKYWVIVPGDWTEQTPEPEAESDPRGGVLQASAAAPGVPEFAIKSEANLKGLLLRRPHLQYPEMAKLNRVEGVVRVSVLVNEDGKVARRGDVGCSWNELTRAEQRTAPFHRGKCVHILSGPSAFHQEVLEAWARGALFAPYIGPDGPSRYRAIIDVEFVLD